MADRNPKPDVPDAIPKYIADGLDKQDAQTLREIAGHAEALAQWREREAERELEERAAEVNEDGAPDEWDADEWRAVVEDADAPPKATLTTKTIDGRDYFYYQWREGDSIESEYVAPVIPAE